MIHICTSFIQGQSQGQTSSECPLKEMKLILNTPFSSLLHHKIQSEVKKTRSTMDSSNLPWLQKDKKLDQYWFWGHKTKPKSLFGILEI